MTSLPPAVAELLAGRLSALGPGTPNEPVRGKLTAFHPHAADPELGKALHAALWLYHDFLTESHDISQDLTSPTGSLLHGMSRKPW